MEPIKNSSLQVVAKNNILKYIKENTFSNNKLPTEEMFSEMLGISRVTIRSVLNELASEGFIFRKHGKGTFVNMEALKIKTPITPLKPFYSMITDLGYECQIEDLGYEILEASEVVAKNLNINFGEKVVFTKKIFYADNNPVVYCEDYFPLNFLKETDDCFKIKDYKYSIFQFIKEKCKKEVSWDKIEIATVTTGEKKELEDIFRFDKVKAILQCSGINYDDNNIPIVYAIEYVDTKYISFSLIRKKSI